MTRVMIVAGALFLGIGVGFGMAVAFFLTDNPSIIVQERWRTVTTAPPVTYVPETPFHIDRKVICDPPTTAPPTTVSTTTTTTMGASAPG